MTRVQLAWPVVAIAAAGLVLLGAGAAYLWRPQPPAPMQGSAGATAPPPPGAGAGPLPDVEIALSGDAMARAGIVVSPVTASGSPGSLRLAGVVEANAYRQVVVTPLVSGRITRVAVMLGDRVARNAPLAEIHSPDLAEAQTQYLSMRAEFQAVEQEIARTTRLVEIGAASRQELERIHAEHVRHRTEVDTARTRLQLLGMTAQQIDALTASGQIAATVVVMSPLAGVVTERSVNPGTNVDPATPLLTVVDLSTVWVVADLYERDFARVSVGSAAVVTTRAFPDDRIAGTVAYIDPQVNAETRTARIRVEVQNPGRRLRLGMYADVHIETPEDTKALLVPRSAVQNVGERTVVYLADPRQAGRFIEREIRLGDVAGDHVAVRSGVAPAD